MAVYFMRRADGAIKIGTSSFVRNRMKLLGGELLGVEEGDHPRERALHMQFGHLWVEGEWFRPGADLLAHIASLPDPAPWLEKPALPRSRGAYSNRGAYSKRGHVDRLFQGQFDDLVHERRAQGCSWRRLSSEIHRIAGAEVSHETLRQWFPDDEAAAS